VPTLPTPSEQSERLIALGVHDIAGLPASWLRDMSSQSDSEDMLLVVHPDLAPASALVPLLTLNRKRAFVVSDMTDVDEFTTIPSVCLPADPVYLVADVDRGDFMANRTPDEALPAIRGARRTPLTLTEGLHWLLQRPDTLERNHCFMTVGSRRRKPDGSLDTRTPALWISNGTGRDGAANRNAPKVGWCWAGNRHTWLGFASAAGRFRVAGDTISDTVRGVDERQHGGQPRCRLGREHDVPSRQRYECGPRDGRMNGAAPA
jgi:hypothetical protein